MSFTKITHCRQGTTQTGNKRCFWTPSATAAFDLAMNAFAEYLTSENDNTISADDSINTAFNPENMEDYERHATI